MTTDTPALEFDATVRRGGFTLDARFRCGPGLTALFGPSGAGKSTVLSLIAGTLRADRGKISIGQRVLLDTKTSQILPPDRRRVGIVSQEGLLFPHLSVRQNVFFSHYFGRGQQNALDADAVMGTLGIKHLLGRRPAGLSGGERQRVALARALLSAPDLLLMDEPLAGIDDERRREILQLVEHVRDHFKVPILYVTHRTDEVLQLACKVILIDHGRISAEGLASELIVRHPLSVRTSK